jgi:hypothetical protein
MTQATASGSGVRCGAMQATWESSKALAEAEQGKVQFVDRECGTCGKVGEAAKTRGQVGCSN